MYSKLLKKYIGKNIMLQISDGDSSLVFYKTNLEYLDKDIIIIRNDSGSKMIFNSADIQTIGIGDFAPPEKVEKKNDTSYA